MRLALVTGLLLLFVSRAANAQETAPDESWVDLPPPPPPPPGADPAIEPDGPAPPEIGEPPTVEGDPTPRLPPPAPGHSVGTTTRTDFAHDDDHRAIDIPKRNSPEGWYGWQILVGDAAAGFWALLPPPSGLVFGGGTYLVAAPAIHLGHKRGLAALGSFALRLGVPAGASALIDGDNHCYDGCIGPGMALGAVVVTVVDTVWIAREDEKPPAKRGATIAPGVGVTREGATISVGGIF